MKFIDRPLLTLFGTQIAKSLSPQIHSSWLQEFGSTGEYTLMELPKGVSLSPVLNDFVDVQGGWGANITHPFKVSCLEWKRAKLDNNVKLVGSANTLYQKNGSWYWGNTDIAGAQASLSAFEGTRNQRFGALVLGSGGAAQAVVHALREFSLCTEIICVYRSSPPEGFGLQNPFVNFVSCRDNWEKEGEFKCVKEGLPLLLINATPVGSESMANPWAQRYLKTFHLNIFGYWDLLYWETKSFQYARGLGIPSLNGWTMLKVQAWESFKLWFPQVSHLPLAKVEPFISEISSLRIQNV